MEDYAAIRDYAAFIWSAWGIAGALMLAIWAASTAALRRQRALLATLETTRNSRAEDAT